MISLQIKVTFILLCLLSVHSFAQFPEQFSEQLPSSNVYYTYSDKDGNLWFGTDKGVCRYNGFKFEHFGLSNGLPNNDVFVIDQDKKGRIWFGTYLSKLSYFENDSIYSYVFNDSLEKYLTENSVKFGFHFFENGDMALGDAKFGLVLIDSIGNIQFKGEPNRNIFQFEKQLLKARLSSSSKPKGSHPEVTINSYSRDLIKTVYYHSYPNELNRLNQDQHYVCKNITGNMLYIQGRLYGILGPNKSTFKQLNKFFINLFCDEQGRVWLCSRYNGVYVFENEKLQDTIAHFLDGYSVTHMTRDFQGGYWFSTLEGGVFHYPVSPINENEYNVLNLPVSQLENGPGKTFFILTDQGDVLEIKNHKSKLIARFDEKKYDDYSFILYDKTKNILFAKNSELSSIVTEDYKLGRINFYPESNLKTRSYQTFLDFKGERYELHFKHIYRVNGDNYTPIRGSDIFEQNHIRSIISLKDTTWLGTEFGLYYMTDDTIAKFNLELANNQRISTLEGNKDSLFIAIQDVALVLKTKNKYVTINRKNGLYSLRINTLLKKGNKLLIGTDKGLYQLNLHSDSMQVRLISQQQGLDDLNIKTMIDLNDQLLLGGSFGIRQFDWKRLPQKIIIPKLHLRLKSINGNQVHIEDLNQLEHWQNDLEVSLEAISFTDTRHIKYEWKIKGKSEKWIKTNYSNLSFKELPPGKYTLMARCSVIPGVWSDVSEMSFVISPPFYLTWYFILLEILAGLTLIIASIYYRIKKIEKRAKQRVSIIRQKTELEMKALRAQMNPHFIYNTMNSIQYLIKNKMNDEAELYLVKFAKLMRKVMSQSPQKLITLKDELDITKKYIELETLRFPDKFDFIISIEPEIDQEATLVPGLILQPFMENSITHGLLNKDGKGKLILMVELNKGILHYKITDNGIGREKAKEIKEKKGLFQKSHGMTNTKNRLDLVNISHGKEIVSMTITDLKDKDGTVTGTQIDLNIKLHLREKNKNHTN